LSSYGFTFHYAGSLSSTGFCCEMFLSHCASKHLTIRATRKLSFLNNNNNIWIMHAAKVMS
jgi:hypothetical protein